MPIKQPKEQPEDQHRPAGDIPNPWGRKFKVFRMSTNTNGFGLRGVWLMDKEGNAFEVGASYFAIETKGIEIGAAVTVPFLGDEPNWAEFGVEIPRAVKPKAPPAVIKEVWDMKVGG